jgi:phosphatidate cytidylyltransferase
MKEHKTRLASGLVYIAFLLGSIYLGPIYFALFFGFLLVLAILEFCKLTHQKPNLPMGLVLLLWIVLSSINFEFNQIVFFSLIFINLVFSAWLIYFLFTKKDLSVSNGMKRILLLTYITLPFIWMGNLNWINDFYNYTWILFIFILIWVNDTFAYITGISFGKRKLFERISPKKTKEGFFGGMLFTCVFGAIISLQTDYSLLFWLLFCVFVSIFGTLGDLIESKFKRMAGVKDSGKIMPGHGGVLDRLDSVLFIMPFVLPLIYLIN